ncbi:acyl-CoA thioesterase/BAAT N-terminal domain-containing protein [Streptomyces tubbatahanensis]|uniref:Acyl-CoA thioesterase/BAAT N-terminal domain-containing protein n=1 Tax=Streptomyces tubbatahanensis TaxID=2923272 RepID=A0ABY3XW20_9ACTN|nr:acyl-CoA thioesterase/BAAT N-terminal domain-containing protein [Streptomyces tubbatahanensis]UNS98575.1 acyl-CoA thioesterase/BAAT N-terminal domain-containing protein [Streptomyces tubbatahanensis]
MGRMANVRTTAATALVVALAAAGCASEDSGSSAGSAAKPSGRDGVRFETDHPRARADQPTSVRLEGLTPRTRVAVRAQTEDQRGGTWAATVTRTADSEGTVDLGRDGTGRLLSGMLPTGGRTAKMTGSGKAFSYHPGPPAEQRAYTVRFTATATTGEHKGQRVARRDLVRQWLTEGTTHRKLTVDENAESGVDGDLYLPPKGGARQAPVLVFGGSEGGNAGTYTAALLASHGHPAMSVCYFRCGKGSERPNGIDDIDLDYFTRAGELLREQEGADPDRLAVMGNSRGSEAAQLLGQRRPEVFHDVIAYAPSSKVNGPYLSGTTAWTDHGQAIPTGPIPLDHVRGSVLAVAGGNDKMWGSQAAAGRMAGQGAKKLVYPDAGHHVNWFPYAQPGQEGGADGAVTRTSEADQRARADSWPKVLKLLN